MGIKMDISGASPLELKGIEMQAAMRSEETGASVSAQEFAENYFGQIIATWAEAVVDNQLPELRPTAKRLLNLSPERQYEAMKHLARLEAEQEKETEAETAAVTESVPEPVADDKN